MRKGATTYASLAMNEIFIVALRNEKGSYNNNMRKRFGEDIVALRNEKGSYNYSYCGRAAMSIVALRNEKGSYNHLLLLSAR